MKNSFEVRGKLTAIFASGPKGKMLEVLIDTDMLPKADSFPNTWFAWWNKKTNSCYAVGDAWSSGREKGKSNRLYMHRYLFDAPKGLVIDHIDHNTLNNTSSNIRIVTVGQNNQNFKGARSDNKNSGLLNVHWSKGSQKWMVQMTVNGVYHYVGLYEDINDAKRAASDARARLKPYSLDAHLMKGDVVNG